MSRCLITYDFYRFARLAWYSKFSSLSITFKWNGNYTLILVSFNCFILIDAVGPSGVAFGSMWALYWYFYVNTILIILTWLQHNFIVSIFSLWSLSIRRNSEINVLLERPWSILQENLAMRKKYKNIARLSKWWFLWLDSAMSYAFAYRPENLSLFSLVVCMKSKISWLIGFTVS